MANLLQAELEYAIQCEDWALCDAIENEIIQDICDEIEEYFQ